MCQIAFSACSNVAESGTTFSPSDFMAWQKSSSSIKDFHTVLFPWPANLLVESHPLDACLSHVGLGFSVWIRAIASIMCLVFAGSRKRHLGCFIFEDVKEV